MTDARSAIGSVFGAVNETALTVTAAVSAVSGSVAMLNGYIAKERKKADARDTIEMSDYLDRLVEDSAKETARRREETNKWLAADPNRKELYQLAYNKYAALFPNFKPEHQNEEAEA